MTEEKGLHTMPYRRFHASTGFYCIAKRGISTLGLANLPIIMGHSDPPYPIHKLCAPISS